LGLILVRRFFAMFTPDEQEDAARLVERMQRAGWIDKV